MSATTRKAPGSDERTHGTLGALLYSDRTKNLPHEREWVALVRSMAAGDQLALRELYGRMYRLVFTLTMRTQTTDRRPRS